MHSVSSDCSLERAVVSVGTLSCSNVLLGRLLGSTKGITPQMRRVNPPHDSNRYQETLLASE